MSADDNILDLSPPQPGKRIPYGDDVNQFGELRLPDGKGPYPVVIFIHGGFWRAAYDLRHTGHLCEAVTKAGCASWNIEYRRVGQPGGGYPGTLDDVRAAARRIMQIPDLDLERIVIAGHSAGGQLALWLAAQEVVSFRRVVALAAVSDLRRGYDLHLGRGAIHDFIGCAPEHCAHRYALLSPVELLPMNAPQVLVHGTNDEVVPCELSERFTIKSGNARLVTLTGTGHFELIDPRAREWPVVLETLISALSA